MTMEMKRQLHKAIEDAEAFRDLFSGCWERWELAGSIRRKRAEVNDVDHVAIPKFGPVAGANLFAEPVNLMWHRAEELVKRKATKQHVYQTTIGAQHKWGEKMRGMTFAGFKHEIWTATPKNWGAILLIRTGPWEFSKGMVDRFLRGGLYRQQDGALVHVATGEPVDIPDEETYFRMLGMQFISPEARQ